MRSEERLKKYNHPRRNLGNLGNFGDIVKQAGHERSESNKNLYYLQFLSGQPVWSVNKEAGAGPENDNSNLLNLNNDSSFEILNQSHTYDEREQPETTYQYDISGMDSTLSK